MENGVNIKQHTGLTSFLVQSDSHPNVWYTVDLVSYWCNGACDCMDFRTRMEPHLRKGKPQRLEWICKHIRYCRSQLASWLLETLLNMEYEKAHPKTHPQD